MLSIIIAGIILLVAFCLYLATQTFQIRKQVNQMQCLHAASPIAKHVTVTIGAGSGFPNDALPENKFIWLADKALYAAKAKGRNCSIGEKWRAP